MNVALTAAEGLPDSAYISIRVGSTRRQASWKTSETFSFPSADARSVHIDVFDKLGSTQVTLAGMKALQGKRETSVNILQKSGQNIKLGLSMDVPEAVFTGEGAHPKHQEAARQAMSYMEKSGIQQILSQMVQQLMLHQPKDALAFMADFIAEQQMDQAKREAADALKRAAEGEVAAESMPDLSGHCSLLADVLNKDPGLYERLRGKVTAKGVDFALVIKPGIENKGHKMIKTAGLVAGDAECYTTFGPLFDAVLDLRYGTSIPAPGTRQPLALDASLVSAEPLDPRGRHVVSTQVRVGRNLATARFPSACSLDERREVERVLASALLELGGDLSGAYHPLAGSDSFPAMPGGMSAAQEEALEECHALFYEPDSAVAVSSGFARDWPDARGVFATEDVSAWAWINDEDHLRLHCAQDGPSLRDAFAQLCVIHSTLVEALQRRGHAFARDARLGFLSTGVTNVGSSLCATVFVRLPLLSAQPEFRKACKQLQLQASYQSTSGVWALSNIARLGTSEADQVNAVANGCRELIAMEVKLEDEAVSAHPEVPPLKLPVRGGRILRTELCLAHSLVGLPSVTSCSREQRRESERVLARSLLELTGPLAGEYFPLPGSESCPMTPRGMSWREMERLQASGIILEDPTGLEPEWPDARGVFMSRDGGLIAWINRDEHLVLIATLQDNDGRAAAERLRTAFAALALSVKHDQAEGQGDQLVLSQGTNLCVRVSLLLPKLATSLELLGLCQAHGLRLVGKTPKGVVEVESSPVLGVSEDEAVSTCVNACKKLLQAEGR